MKVAKSLLSVSLLLVLGACGQEVERQVVMVSPDGPASFGIREPNDAAAESIDQRAQRSQDCGILEGNFELPDEKDPCIVSPQELAIGLYTLKSFVVRSFQVESQEQLRFSRLLETLGELSNDDSVSREWNWGASSEVIVDLNLPLQMWRQADRLSFEEAIRHEVVFDKAREVVRSVTTESPSAKGARMYELLEFEMPEKESAISKRWLTGFVEHGRRLLINPGEEQQRVQELDPLKIFGQAVFRRVALGSSEIQAIIQYSMRGENNLNYIIRLALTYELAEKPVEFKP
jgi:hypothetical protein